MTTKSALLLLLFIAAYNYNLAKILTDLADPVIPKEYCTIDFFNFL